MTNLNAQSASLTRPMVSAYRGFILNRVETAIFHSPVIGAHPAVRRRIALRRRFAVKSLNPFPDGFPLCPNAAGKPPLTRIDHFDLNVQRRIHSGISDDARFKSQVLSRSLPIGNIMAGRPRAETTNDRSLS